MSRKTRKATNSSVHLKAMSNGATRSAPKSVISVVDPPKTDVNPTLLFSVVADNASKAIEWYEKALGAKAEARYHDQDGRVLHSVLVTPYGARIAIEDYYPGMHVVEPARPRTGTGRTAKGSTYVYVTIPKGDWAPDDAVEKMRAAGATVVMECEDAFYGHRYGMVVDSYDVCWVFAKEIEGFAMPDC